MFEGVYTALVTPFIKGEVDFDSLHNLIEFQLAEGIEGLVVNGTTAESPNLSRQEVVTIFKAIDDQVQGRLPLVLGAGSNSTHKLVSEISELNELKPDGFLSVVPYYNKPQQRGIVAHYEALAKVAKSPVIAYNVPGRTVISTAAETIVEISKIENVVGIKEASGDMGLVKEVAPHVEPGFLLTSGDDGTALDFNGLGGKGIISVISHLLPRETVELRKNSECGALDCEAETYNNFHALNDVLYVEANPVPVKYCLFKMGLIGSPEVRLPLVSASKETQNLLETVLVKRGLLK